MNLTKLGCVVSVGLASMVYAADPAPAPAPLKPSQILQGRPDANVAMDDTLGTEFRSLAAGIAFRPPAGGKEIRRAVGGDEIVQYVYDKQNWRLKVSRLQLSKPVPLLTDGERGKDGVIRQGLLETMAQQLKVDTGGADILRQDPINLASIPIGMIAARYKVSSETRLTQRALVQADEKEQLYYIFDFTTPAPKDGAIAQDPEMKKVVDLFTHVVESIQVLDQSKLVNDQVDRLFRTKGLYVNLTEPRLTQVLTPQRWLRLIRDGKDIGYSYVVEEVAASLPRKGEAPVVRATNASGIRVGIRSRTFPDSGVQVDAESWSWIAMDKKQEEWYSILVMQNANQKEAKLKKVTSTESGVAVWRIKPVKDEMVGEKDNPGNRGVRVDNDYKLTVTTSSSITGLGDPVTKDLPPFYLPKTMDHLLPRLMPHGPDARDRGYMFATYVSDNKEVVRRYVDVGNEGEYVLNAQKIHAIPIRDRIGLEGSVTTHYVTPEGAYLGSVNADSKVTIVPTDAATLDKMWKDANLTRPGDVELIKPSADAGR